MLRFWANINKNLPNAREEVYTFRANSNLYTPGASSFQGQYSFALFNK